MSRKPTKREVERASHLERSFRIRMAGAFLLFVAFVSQNAVMPLAESELRKLERDQLVIDLEQTRRDVWHSGLVLSLNQAQPNPQLVGQFLVQTLEANKNLIAWSAGRAGASSGEYTQKIDSRNAAREQAQTLLAAGDLAKLVEMANAAAVETTVRLPEDDERFFARLADARSRETRWYWSFLVAYVIGSCLIGLDVLKQHRLNLRKDS